MKEHNGQNLMEGFRDKIQHSFSDSWSGKVGLGILSFTIMEELRGGGLGDCMWVFATHLRGDFCMCCRLIDLGSKLQARDNHKHYLISRYELGSHELIAHESRIAKS